MCRSMLVVTRLLSSPWEKPMVQGSPTRSSRQMPSWRSIQLLRTLRRGDPPDMSTLTTRGRSLPSSAGGVIRVQRRKAV